MEQRITKIEEKQHAQDLVILEMSNNIKHMTKSFDDLKEQLSKHLDQQASFHQVVGGLEKLVSDQVQATGLNTVFRTNNNEMIEDIKEERRDNKRRAIDFIWKFGWVFLALYIAVSAQLQAKDTQDESITLLTEQISHLVD